MITRKTYVRYSTIDSKESVKDWFKTVNEIYSNRDDNYTEAVERLVQYKENNLRTYGKNPDKKKYRNIWAHQMIVMIPTEFHEVNTAIKFINEYMIQVHDCYKTNNYLYCFKLFTQGKGMYADIICFTRKIYDTVRKKTVVYTSDYYWNPITKRKAKKTDINAVLLHAKGDPKLDKNGNPIVTDVYVAQVEKKIFKYSNFNINKMTSWLRSIVNDVRLTLIRTVEKLFEISKKYISYPKRIKDASKYEIARRCLKSNFIKTINDELSNCYEHMLFGRFTDGYDETNKSFNKLIYKIDKLVNKTDIEWIDKGQKTFIYLGSKQKFADFKKELSKLKEYIFILIDEWWKLNICDYWIDDNGEPHFI